jgi:hypothetical protein
MTVMGEGAAELHELYSSYVAAGFTPAQAVYLVGQVLRALTAAAQTPEE